MDVYTPLGVRPLINAVGTVTRLGGSLMPPEVIRAMEMAAGAYVDVSELHVAAGRRIAELVGVEAAYVSSGAAGGLALAAAACIAGTDPAKIAKLPHGEGLRAEILIQRSHRTGWEQALRVEEEGRIVEAEPDPDALRRGIGPDTVAMAFFVAYARGDSVPLAEAARIANESGIPLIVDAAAELPPKSNLTAFTRAGADLVIFSGGKGLRGRQCSGLILGRGDLIEACRLNGNPNTGIGRPMKVGKEEIVGLVAALERFIRLDHDVEMRRWEAQVSHLVEVIQGLPGVRAERVLDRTGHIPLARVSSDRIEPGVIAEQLRKGEPRIEVGVTGEGLTVNPHTLTPGDERAIARRLREILR